jgi:hypothetical protein
MEDLLTVLGEGASGLNVTLFFTLVGVRRVGESEDIPECFLLGVLGLSGTLASMKGSGGSAEVVALSSPSSKGTCASSSAS